MVENGITYILICIKGPDIQDDETRISSVASLLNTSLPEVNYRTLNAFVSHLHQ